MLLLLYTVLKENVQVHYDPGFFVLCDLPTIKRGMTTNNPTDDCTECDCHNDIKF